MNKKVNNLIDSIFDKEKDYNKDVKNFERCQKLYNDELQGYEMIRTIKQLKKMKPGGYVRYINEDGELRFGGIFTKLIINHENVKNKYILILRNKKSWGVSWNKNIIFYKNHVTKGENFKKMLIQLVSEMD